MCTPKEINIGRAAREIALKKRWTSIGARVLLIISLLFQKTAVTKDTAGSAGNRLITYTKGNIALLIVKQCLKSNGHILLKVITRRAKNIILLIAIFAAEALRLNQKEADFAVSARTNGFQNVNASVTAAFTRVLR